MDILAVVAEKHIGLAHDNVVFALGDAMKCLELGSVDTLRTNCQPSESLGSLMKLFVE